MYDRIRPPKKRFKDYSAHHFNIGYGDFNFWQRKQNSYNLIGNVAINNEIIPNSTNSNEMAEKFAYKPIENKSIENEKICVINNNIESDVIKKNKVPTDIYPIYELKKSFSNSSQNLMKEKTPIKRGLMLPMRNLNKSMTQLFSKNPIKSVQNIQFNKDDNELDKSCLESINEYNESTENINKKVYHHTGINKKICIPKIKERERLLPLLKPNKQVNNSCDEIIPSEKSSSIDEKSTIMRARSKILIELESLQKKKIDIMKRILNKEFMLAKTSMSETIFPYEENRRQFMLVFLLICKR